MSNEEDCIYVRTECGEMLRFWNCWELFKMVHIGEGNIFGRAYGSNPLMLIQSEDTPDGYFERLVSRVRDIHTLHLMSMIENYNIMIPEDYQKYRELETDEQYNVAQTYLIRMVSIETETEAFAHQLRNEDSE